ETPWEPSSCSGSKGSCGHVCNLITRDGITSDSFQLRVTRFSFNNGARAQTIFFPPFNPREYNRAMPIALSTNPLTGELYFRLPLPHSNFILTPPRASDTESLMHIIRDPAVHTWLARPSAEWGLDDAQMLNDAHIAQARSVLQAMQEGDGLGFFGDCPLRAIREVGQPDAADVYVGNVSIKRCGWFDVASPQREALIALNDARAVGDGDIVWQVSDFLAPKHHRRGIMTAALSALLAAWFVPRMNVRKMHVCVFLGNAGSVRVLEKLGFVLSATVEDFLLVRGEKRGLQVLDWDYEDALLDLPGLAVQLSSPYNTIPKKELH
ncbi:unnamed protein product, partial [Mycena citricolor]